VVLAKKSRRFCCRCNDDDDDEEGEEEEEEEGANGEEAFIFMRQRASFDFYLLHFEKIKYSSHALLKDETGENQNDGRDARKPLFRALEPTGVVLSSLDIFASDFLDGTVLLTLRATAFLGSVGSTRRRRKEQPSSAERIFRVHHGGSFEVFLVDDFHLLLRGFAQGGVHHRRFLLRFVSSSAVFSPLVERTRERTTATIAATILATTAAAAAITTTTVTVRAKPGR
jgi:hypothetical protein